jgi:ABC-type multidrug transport system fused ATPase/permease subunit
MTIVVITHRLNTVRGADAIHVLDGGTLVESGTWNGLLARAGGRFRQLYDAQADPVELVSTVRPAVGGATA